MPVRRTWPIEAIRNLGRSLNRWDLCPQCGATPSGHTYRADIQAMYCPENFEPLDAQAAAQRARQEEVEAEREFTRATRRRIALQTATKEELRRTAPLESAARRQGPILRPGAPRSYFDE